MWVVHPVQSSEYLRLLQFFQCSLCNRIIQSGSLLLPCQRLLPESEHGHLWHQILRYVLSAHDIASYILPVTIEGLLKEEHMHTLFPTLLVLQDLSIVIPQILYTILLVKPQMGGPSELAVSCCCK